MRITLKQIAQQTGYSVQTVSHILHSHRAKDYNSVTREAVLHAAKALGYRPNRAARIMRDGKFGVIGLVRSRELQGSDINAQFLFCLQRNLELLELTIKCLWIHEDRLVRKTYVEKLMDEWAIDAAVMASRWKDSVSIERLIGQYKLPAIWLAKRSIDSVFVDVKSAYSQAVHMLIGLGHRSIMYVDPEHPSALEIGSDTAAQCGLSGYDVAMRDQGLSAQHLFLKDVVGTKEDPIDRLELLYKQINRPTALICNEVVSANQALLAAYRAGLSIPKDLTIVALGNEAAGIVGVHFTQWIYPHETQGELVTRMVEQKLRMPNATQASASVAMLFVPGTTSGKAPIA